jgi:hypothetical protein
MRNNFWLKTAELISRIVTDVGLLSVWRLPERLYTSKQFKRTFNYIKRNYSYSVRIDGNYLILEILEVADFDGNLTTIAFDKY